MKKIITIIFICFISIIFCVLNYYNNTDYKKNIYKQSETITFYEYLYSEKSDKDWETLKLNSNGDVIFKNKVVLTKNGTPLNANTAYTNTELKILFAAEGAKPRKGCDTNDTEKNGILGCYIDNPDE